MQDDGAIGLAIVRGERSWRDAGLLGMTVEREPDGLLRGTFARGVHLDVSLRELAEGLLRPQPSAEDTMAWAYVVSALTSPSESDEHPAHDVVIDALWGMSFGEAMRPEWREALERFVASTDLETTVE